MESLWCGGAEGIVIFKTHSTAQFKLFSEVNLKYDVGHGPVFIDLE